MGKSGLNVSSCILAMSLTSPGPSFRAGGPRLSPHPPVSLSLSRTRFCSFLWWWLPLLCRSALSPCPRWLWGPLSQLTGWPEQGANWKARCHPGLSVASSGRLTLWQCSCPGCRPRWENWRHENPHLHVGKRVWHLGQYQEVGTSPSPLKIWHFSFAIQIW